MGESCPTAEESPCVWAGSSIESMRNDVKCRCCADCVFRCLQAGFSSLERGCVRESKGGDDD